MRRIWITLPDHQADAVDRNCRWRGAPRSRVIQQALELYLTSPEAIKEADELYEAGYRDQPEDPSEIDAYAKAASEVLGPEVWE